MPNKKKRAKTRGAQLPKKTKAEIANILKGFKTLELGLKKVKKEIAGIPYHAREAMALKLRKIRNHIGIPYRYRP
jgi:hypothetical protein